jgi:hypothetical protein
VVEVDPICVVAAGIVGLVRDLGIGPDLTGAGARIVRGWGSRKDKEKFTYMEGGMGFRARMKGLRFFLRGFVIMPSLAV